MRTPHNEQPSRGQLIRDGTVHFYIKAAHKREKVFLHATLHDLHVAVLANTFCLNMTGRVRGNLPCAVKSTAKKYILQRKGGGARLMKTLLSDMTGAVAMVRFFKLPGYRANVWMDWQGEERETVQRCVRVLKGVPRGQRGMRVTAHWGTAIKTLGSFIRLAAGISKK